MFTVDTNGCFTAMNQAAKQTFGCKDGETCCWTLYDFVAPDHRQGIKDILAVLIGGERSILREMSVITARGRRGRSGNELPVAAWQRRAKSCRDYCS